MIRVLRVVEVYLNGKLNISGNGSVFHLKLFTQLFLDKMYVEYSRKIDAVRILYVG